MKPEFLEPGRKLLTKLTLQKRQTYIATDLYYCTVIYFLIEWRNLFTSIFTIASLTFSSSHGYSVSDSRFFLFGKTSSEVNGDIDLFFSHPSLNCSRSTSLLPSNAAINPLYLSSLSLLKHFTFFFIWPVKMWWNQTKGPLSYYVTFSSKNSNIK